MRETTKPVKKYLSLEEVEAQLLASQGHVQQYIVAPRQLASPTKMMTLSGTRVPQHVGQQYFDTISTFSSSGTIYSSDYAAIERPHFDSTESREPI